MNKVLPYRDRIIQISIANKSFIILALDLEPRHQSPNHIENLIKNLNPYLCAIKINFHLILAFSKRGIENINRIIHSYGLLSIADIKLNDITNTNQVTLRYLHSMGFDSVIVNPIIGENELRSFVRLAHKFRMGVISLAYMSHENVSEGYGLKVVQKKSKQCKILPLFEIFLQYARRSNVDGIIVGATHLKILKHISSISSIPIYSPGVGTQGGDPKLAIDSGSDYLIIGRSILNSKNKPKKLSNLLDLKEF
ncbi:MAG TPA: orotidine 5'-phosphate decarboxylase [Nitrososphaeraceae archaeon]|nr:orotidine 5'-phosphate decarboxylase [Nitrososphaeraceae archaeon]